MTDLEYGDITVSATSGGTELTSKITAHRRAEYKLRFEVETTDGKRIRPTNGEVSARFYLADHLMYFTVEVPRSVQGVNTLHVYVDGQLESSQPFTVAAA